MSESYDDWLASLDQPKTIFGINRETPEQEAIRYAKEAETVENKKAEKWSNTLCFRYYNTLMKIRFPYFSGAVKGPKAMSLLKRFSTNLKEDQTLKQFFDNAILNWPAIKEKYKSRAEYPELLVLNWNLANLIEDVSAGGTTTRTHRISTTSEDKEYEDPFK